MSTTMSTPPPSHRAEGILNAALDRDPAAREAFIIGACAGEAALLAEVRALLAAHAAMPAGFLAEPAVDGVAASEIDVTIKHLPGTRPPVRGAAERAGEMIGQYKLREQIGEGGFGTVWVADQEQPVRRRVALKIIKLGMDTREVIARFEQERQALAMMDHPNIARVLDAGATEHGRPYFVMELVRGVKITDYCDDQGLSTNERIALFIHVCQAVQHAHQKGIIHRDLKPSNILVTINDGVAVPKVIDFGVAKATQGRLTDGTIYTQFQQMIGTPLYMSPEQAEMTSLDVDTRSDIYALGVLLYELLTGHTPIDTVTMARAGMDEIRRLIREVDPPRPSARLKTLDGNELTTMAKRRHTEPTKLPGALRGDLDWIVMKCIEKDRKRRYDTANGLALDLQRHLKNEVVVARPPTTAYLLSKLIRRNKVAFAAAAAIAASLVIGIAASVWQAVRAEHEAHRAVAAFDELRATAPAFAEQARSLAAKEHYSEAIEKLDYAIKLRPETAEFLVQKADLLQCQFKLAEAATAYRAALALQPDHARAEASLKLCDELLAAPLGPDGKLTRESLGKLNLAMQKQQRPAAELLPVARLLGAEREHLLAYWLDRLKDLPISPEKPLKDRLTIRGDDLFELDLQGTQIADLSPLAGLPLGKLVLWDCKELTDFTLLREFRSLTYLDLDASQMANIALLRGLPLEELHLGGTKVSDLSPLRGMKLKTLGLWGCRLVSDLSPLAGMPITTFYARELANGTDYTPLKSLPLEICVFDKSSVTDLSFLAATPLRELSLNTCASLRGLAWLSEIKSLERLVLPGNYRELPDEDMEAIAALRTHPRLQFLQGDANQGQSGSWRAFAVTQPKDIFWRDWDREQAFLPAIRRSGFDLSLRKQDDGTYRLHNQNLPLSDLTFLKGAPISRLSLPGCKVEDLTPIRDLPLKELWLNGNRIADLAPLRDSGMPLERLGLSGGTFEDLSPLIGLPLKELYLHQCPNVSNVAVLAQIPTLEKVTVPPTARNIEALQKLPRLQRLSFSLASSSPWFPDTAAEDFWEEWPKLGWLRALQQAAIKPKVLNRLPDRTWEVDLDNTAISDLSILAGAPISKFRLQKTGVTDLAPLRGMPLRELNIHGTKVADLSPLRGMQLQSLILGETPVTNLSPLHGMPLTKLHMSGIQVADISALRGMPLVEVRMPWCPQITDLTPLAQASLLEFITLPPNAKDIEFLRHRTTLRRISYTENFNGNSKTHQPDTTASQFWKEYDDAGWRIALRKAGIVPKVLRQHPGGTWEVDLEKSGITDLKILSGAAISVLRLGNTEVSDLTPLRGMLFTHLALYNTKVTDLGPLRGMPLDNLSVSGTAVDNISVLHGMPLRRVRLHNCTNLTDLSPLADCAELTELTLPPNAKNFDFLRDSGRFPKLAHLSFEEDAPKSGTRMPNKTAIEFWKEYDAKRKPAGKQP
jgi:serine/threonine protein kinase/Leucine-rich repeat (LRR) protein